VELEVEMGGAAAVSKVAGHWDFCRQLTFDQLENHSMEIEMKDRLP
jgi:hypothetical protein